MAYSSFVPPVMMAAGADKKTAGAGGRPRRLPFDASVSQQADSQ